MNVQIKHSKTKTLITLSAMVGIWVLGTTTTQASVFTPKTTRVDGVDYQPERVDRVSRVDQPTERVGRVSRVDVQPARVDRVSEEGSIVFQPERVDGISEKDSSVFLPIVQTEPSVEGGDDSRPSM
jgi:hypothetical protein